MSILDLVHEGDACRRDLYELAREMNDLATQARAIAGDIGGRAMRRGDGGLERRVGGEGGGRGQADGGGQHQDMATVGHLRVSSASGAATLTGGWSRSSV